MSVSAWLLLALCGCGSNLTNLTASLGGDSPGERGELRVAFINNTPFRAVFTAGTFDQTDPSFRPTVQRFALEDGGPNLNGNTAGAIVTFPCARLFGMGSPRLLDLIRRNVSDFDPEDPALETGLRFFDVESDDGSDDETPDPEGTAPPFEAYLGVDYPCNALLIIRLETDERDPPAFRVDFEVIPSASDR